MKRAGSVIGLCLIGLCATASGAQTASNPPPHPAMHHQQGPKSVFLDIADGAKAVLWKPDLSRVPVQVENKKVVLPSTGMDNYHALVANLEKDRLVETAIRYEYLRGKPSGHSPRELLAASKSTLEIVPSPVPREHYHYFSGQEWDFLVLFQGHPLPGRQVRLTTSNGSQASAVTDPKGRVSIRLPDDFPDLQAGTRDRRSAEFELEVSHEAEGVEYRTRLNAAYRVNPRHWRSGSWGLVMAGAGFLVGGMVGRRAARDNGSRRRSR